MMDPELYVDPRMDKLASALGVGRFGAVGICVCLIEMSVKVHPVGAIGAWNNAVIARYMSYEGDPDELLHALVKAGWIYRSDRYRLILDDALIKRENTGDDVEQPD